MAHACSLSDLKKLLDAYNSSLKVDFETCALLRLPNFIIAQVFRGKEHINRIKTDINSSECIICKKTVGDVIVFVLHALIFHREYELFGILQYENKKSHTIVFNFILKTPIYHKTTHLVTIDHNEVAKIENEEESMVHKINVLVNSVFIHENLIAGHKLIVYYKQVDTHHDVDDFEYWTDKHQLYQKSELLQNNLVKLNYIILGDKEREFFRLWSSFVCLSKEEMLESNYPFTNFFNTNLEMYIWLCLFIDKYHQLLKDLYPELSLHVVTLFLHKLIGEQQLYNIKLYCKRKILA